METHASLVTLAKTKWFPNNPYGRFKFAINPSTTIRYHTVQRKREKKAQEASPTHIFWLSRLNFHHFITACLSIFLFFHHHKSHYCPLHFHFLMRPHCILHTVFGLFVESKSRLKNHVRFQQRREPLLICMIAFHKNSKGHDPPRNSTK